MLFVFFIGEKKHGFFAACIKAVIEHVIYLVPVYGHKMIPCFYSVTCAL